MTTPSATPLISVRNVYKRFSEPYGIIQKLTHVAGVGPGQRVARAVTDVNIDVHAGDTLSIVGESGCGKSTLAKIICGLMPPSDGSVLIHGHNLALLRGRKLRTSRLRMQMIFQNPFASLNPRMRIGDIIGEAPKVHGLTTRENHDAYVDEVMLQVGLDPTDKYRFAHQFSGGQRQRIGIARALAVKPDVLICDEAVAALDVSIQAQILNLLTKLREEQNLTYIFISHDLGVVRHISDRIAVMYAGRIVETGKATDVFNDPQHPYTKMLLEEAPRLGRQRPPSLPAAGETPSPFSHPHGCAFHTRCRITEQQCRSETPTLKQSQAHSEVACHLATTA